MALVVCPSKNYFQLLIIVFVCVLPSGCLIHSAEVNETSLTSDIFTTSLDLARSALASLNDGNVDQAEHSLTTLREEAQAILTKANAINKQLKKKEMDMVQETESLERDLGKSTQVLRELNAEKIVIDAKMKTTADMLSKQETEVSSARLKVSEARDELTRARNDNFERWSIPAFIGGMWGAMFGGPPGALLGAAIGGGGGALVNEMEGRVEKAKGNLNSKEDAVRRSINDLNQLRNNLKSKESEMKSTQQKIDSLERQISQYQSDLVVVKKHVAVVIKTKIIFEQLDHKAANADEWTEILQKMLGISSEDLEAEGMSILKGDFRSAWDDVLEYVDNMDVKNESTLDRDEL